MYKSYLILKPETNEIGLDLQIDLYSEDDDLLLYSADVRASSVKNMVR
jgi:hypothetical protein